MENEPARRSRASRTLLVFVGLKLAFDATHPASLFSRFEAQAVRPSVLAHAAGAAVALIYVLSPLARSRAALRLAVRPSHSNPTANLS